MKKILLSAVLVLVASSAFAGLTNSKHDLSSTGSNPAKGTSDQLCKYCHVPHNATTAKALWARNAGNAPVLADMYTNNGSLDATPQVPTLPQTLACLSCHNTAGNTGSHTTDSTATGNLTGMTNTKRIMDANGLKDDHPVGFNYGTNLVTADTATGGQVGLTTPLIDKVGGNANGTGPNTLPLFGGATVATGGTLECATCHAVHGVGNGYMFLRTTAKGSVLCLKCHVK